MSHRIVNDLLRKVKEQPRLKWVVPSLEAIDVFLARPATVTSGPPHIRGHMDLKRMMIIVVFAALPCALMGIYLYGWRAAAVIATSYVFGVGTEGIFAGIRRETLNEGAFVTCILYPLILPVTIPLWMVAVGIVFGVVFAKEVFGGTGYNIYNPAMVSRCFLYVCFPSYMTGKVWALPYHGGFGGFVHWAKSAGEMGVDYAGKVVDALTSATPASAWKNIESAGAYKDLPTSDLILGFIPGCIGETCKWAIIIAGIVLLLTRVADWRLMLSPILAAVILSSIVQRIGSGNQEIVPPGPMLNLFAGGLLFGSVFMVTDPVSAPMLPASKWIYGTMIGLLAVLIRSYSGFPQGFMFAVLLMNTFAPLLDYFFRKARYAGRRAAA
jgi:Na(+)-translocating NADH:ubiquinone oxidoreductase B subunit